MISRTVISHCLGTLVLVASLSAQAQDPPAESTAEHLDTAITSSPTDRMLGGAGTVIVVQRAEPKTPPLNKVATDMWGAGWTSWFVGDIGVALLPNCPTVPKVAAPMAWGGLVVLAAGTGYQIGSGDDVPFYAATAAPAVYAGYITGKRRFPEGFDIPVPKRLNIFRAASWEHANVNGGRVGAAIATAFLIGGVVAGYLTDEEPGDNADRLEYTVLPPDQAAALMQALPVEGLDRTAGGNAPAVAADAPAPAPWLPAGTAQHN